MKIAARAAHGVFLVVALVVTPACTHPAKVGELKNGTEYRPAAKTRACHVDTDCVAIDTDCRGECPGGGAINKNFLDKFKLIKSAACAKARSTPNASRTPNAKGEKICVAAQIHCRAKLCTWVYEGPDPNAL